MMRWTPTLTPRRLRQLWYAPLLASAMGLTMLRLLLMARLLDVPGFAAYSTGVLLSSTFCMVGCLGLRSILQREWPVKCMRGQKRLALVRAAQCNALAIASAGAYCLLAAIGPSVEGVGPELVAIGVLHGLTQHAFLVATTESRSSGDPLGYAVQQFSRSLLALSLGALVALAGRGPVAVLAAEAFVSAALALSTQRASLARAALGWRAVFTLALRRLPQVPWPSALTLMAAMLAAFATLNADRWMAMQRLVPAQFALYSFAAILLALAQAFQALINASVYPLLARRYAAFGKAVTFGICLRASTAVLLLGTLASIPGIALARWVITHWYPQYGDAIDLVPLLMLAGVLRISDFWSSFLMIAGHETRMLLVNLATIACATGIWLPWRMLWSQAPASPLDFVLLAVLLSAFGSAFTAAAAWQVRLP